MVANEALDSFMDIMCFSPLTTSENEENTAENRWENEGGNSGELRTLAASQKLIIPILVSTEQAIKWGSHLDTEQHTTLVQTQRTLSKNALAERNMQRMVDLATQSQLLREAAEAFVLPEHNCDLSLDRLRRHAKTETQA